MSKTKVSKAKLESAKNLYMEYMSIRKIAAHVGISASTVQYHASNYWAEERDIARMEDQRDREDVKAVKFGSIEEVTIQIMEKALKDLATRDRPPTVGEAKQASEIMNILDKIKRLDKGEATEIVSNQEKALTVETIARKLSLDPFQKKPKEIPFEETTKTSK